MQTLKYKVISTKAQYKEYCNMLEQMVFSQAKDRNTKDEIALLTLLIEKWDADHVPDVESDPVQLLHSFMKDRGLNAKQLSDHLGISKGYVSDILHYKKGLSKDVIRKLSVLFKVSQEAFNRPYKLMLEKTTKVNAGKVKSKSNLTIA